MLFLNKVSMCSCFTMQRTAGGIHHAAHVITCYHMLSHVVISIRAAAMSVEEISRSKADMVTVWLDAKITPFRTPIITCA